MLRKIKKIEDYCVLNDLEILPYDLFSPHQEKLSSRHDAMVEISKSRQNNCYSHYKF